MLGRLSALTALAMMLACGGDPAPLEAKSPKSERGSDETRAERKRRKAEERRRKEQEEADAREAEEREERKRKREAEKEDAQETRAAEKEEEKSEPPAKEDPDELERRERKERIRKREEAEAKAAAAKAKKSKKKKKKNVEEVDEADEEEVAEEEALAEEEPKESPFKKKEPKQTAAQKRAAEKKAAAEAKKQAAEEKLAAKKAAEEEKKQAAAEKKAAAEEAKQAKKKSAEEEEVAEEEPAEEEPKKVSEKRKGKAKPEEKVDESEIEVDTASLPPPDPSEESKELDLTVGTPKRDEEEVAVAAPTYAIDRRPLTLGRGKIDVHGGLVATATKVQVNALGTTKTVSAQGLALGATYGIGAKGELGFDYTLGLHPSEVKGPLLFHGAYVAKQTEKLDIALSLGLAIDFINSTDPMTMMTSTRAAKALQVGIWTRYHVGPKLSAFTGLPALPSSTGSLGKSAPLPPIPYPLSIGLSSLDAIALDLPAGLGYQASPKLYTFGALDLARLGMNNATSALIFSDFIPISLGGFYAMPKMDIGAVFSDDLKQAADYLRFDVVVRYSIK